MTLSRRSFIKAVGGTLLGGAVVGTGAGYELVQVGDAAPVENAAPTRRDYHQETVSRWRASLEAENNIFKQAGMKPHFFLSMANMDTNGLENMRTDLERVKAYLEKNNGLPEANKSKITDQIKTLNDDLDTIGLRLTREGSKPGFRGDDSMHRAKHNLSSPGITKA